MPPERFPRFNVLDVGISAVQIPDVIAQMENWIHERAGCHYISVTGMHGVVEAQHEPEFRSILSAADLVVPDGMPLVWLARWRGFALRRRVYGPDLMADFFSQSVARGYKHYLYGGAPGVADRLAVALTKRFPGLAIVGTCSPPFGPPGKEEDERFVRDINNSGADVVWIGLSGVTQDKWMFEHRDKLNVPVLVGVGAAFDFHSGRKKQAPLWMRESGFEWLFRLLQEPKRLWRRYLVYGSRFVYLVALEELGWRR